MKLVKPEKIEIFQRQGAKRLPIQCRVVITGMSCERCFKTEKEALIWAKSYEFHVPSREDITENGRYSCD